MKKRRKETSWRSAAANAFIADAIAQNSPKGSLARKHAGKIAVRHARQFQAIDRANRIKPFLALSGVIGILIAVINILGG